MQKTYELKGYEQYDYPYTPELFPFFYDKQLWIRYLDMLVNNRMNTVYLWNGHPFSSLVKLDDYPEALDVSEEVFEKNQEIFHFLTTEADKRGIWVVQMFYNIHVSKNFSVVHDLPMQLSRPTPLASDYTRKSIAAFVKEYPRVGLLVCLGEAQRYEKDIWLRDVIIAGMKEGMKEAGLTEEPPIIIREHTMVQEAPSIIQAGLEKYQNLYTMMKYNGEGFTTYQPRGPWAEIHRKLSSLSGNHVSNIHLLSNLEPFRYGATQFIQKSVQAARDIHHCTGLHLFPLCYWDWPTSPDVADPPLLQVDRDWIWYAAWGRYAWNPDRQIVQEDAYWIKQLVEIYGSQKAAESILDAYNESGLCAPKIIRRFGITTGGRQTMSLGMTLDQLVRPERYKVWPRLLDSESPKGERLSEYVEKEWNRQPHVGETPPQVIKEILESSKQAVDAIDTALPMVKKNQEEFHRLRNDIHCIRAMSEFYAYKANAAARVLRYQHSEQLSDLLEAIEWLEKSLMSYRRLCELTKDRYRYANGLQTPTRSIPFDGTDGQYHHWSQCLPVYVNELENFREKIKTLQASEKPLSSPMQRMTLQPASIKLLSDSMEFYELTKGAKVFTDRPYEITHMPLDLKGLKGIRFSHGEAKKSGVQVNFETSEPIQLLLGYFQDSRDIWLQPPNLETDAAAARYGGVEPHIRNAISISELPVVNIHIRRYPAGKHTLDLGKGSYLIVGCVKADETITGYDAGKARDLKGIDWLLK